MPFLNFPLFFLHYSSFLPFSLSSFVSLSSFCLSPSTSFLARVRVHTGSCIFCCHKCHTLWVTFSILLLLTSFFVFVFAFCCSFYEHHLCTHYHIFLFLRLVHLQTTACFTKNNVSFSIKQRLVFLVLSIFGGVNLNKCLYNVLSFYPSILYPNGCDTCDSKKTKLPVEGCFQPCFVGS